MLAAGTQVVGGVNARKAGTTVLHNDAAGNPVELPVYASVAEAMARRSGTPSPSFRRRSRRTPWSRPSTPRSRSSSIITEGVPVQDSAEFWTYAKEKGNATRIIGPNCPGIISPGEALVGITPANITGKGPIGLVSKSGTLTYQMMYKLRDLGFSTAIGIGGDPIIGTTHIDALAAFEADPETKAIVMIGEIGGDAEERAADFIKANVTKPVVGYVAGFTAPEGKTMGHAGAIVSGRRAPRRRRRRPSRPPASRSARRRARPRSCSARCTRRSAHKHSAPSGRPRRRCRRGLACQVRSSGWLRSITRLSASAHLTRC